MSNERGFSLIEMLVALGIMMVVTGAVFQMLGSGQSALRTQPEVSDMQQRLRVAADMIYKDLLMAGAGTYQNNGTGTLANYFPAIRPARAGAQSADSDMSYAPDRISIIYVPSTRAQTRLKTTMSSSAANVQIRESESGCPSGGLCGFALGTRAVIFDTSDVGAGYDLFTVTGVSAPDQLAHSSPNPTFSKAYLQDIAYVTEVRHHVYYLDRTNNQLMHYNGHQSDEPLVDNVVGLKFTYYADPDPDSAPKPPTGMSNCVYNAGSPPVPILTDLGGTALKALTPTQLADGPICGTGTNRFDGDLLRVRKVRVDMRVQVASDALRGPDTESFVNAGSAKSGERQVPDFSLSFEVTPRNLNLVR